MLTLRHVLFPTDGSAYSDSAFGYAVSLARRHGATLHVLRIYPLGDPREADGAAARAELQQRAHALSSGKVALVHAAECAVSPALGILAYAEEHEVELIVMSTHGRRGAKRFFLGSVTEEVMRRADGLVLTVRPDIARTPQGFARILAPVDFSPESWLAVAYARHLAALFGARLDLLHVVETLPSYGLADIPVAFPPPSREAETAAHEALLALGHEVDGPAVPVEAHVVAGHPMIGVIETAKALGSDLVVLPTHGRVGLKRLVLGSVAEQVVRRVPCPVLVVRGAGRGLGPAPPVPFLGTAAP